MKKVTFPKMSFDIEDAIREGVYSFCKESGYALPPVSEKIKTNKQLVVKAVRFLLLLITGVIMMISAIGQTAIGAKGGLNRYALTGDDKSFISAFHAGVFTQVKAGKQLVIQPELLLSKEGNAFEENNISFGTYMNYLSVPVMAQLQTKGGLYAEAGPGIAFLLSAKNKETGLPDENVKAIFKGTNFFAGVGAGYRHKIGLGIGLRYNIGLSNISASNSFETKSTGGQLNISYLFKTKERK